MKIAILGYGRMGKEIESIALDRGHEISAIFDIDKPFGKSVDVNGAEVIIDFTLADCVLENLKTAAYFGIPIVEGTTGLTVELDQTKNIDGLTMIFSPNFSVGVYIFNKIAGYAARQLGGLKEYDCYLHEFHHIGKADSPSGTAKSLAHTLLQELPDKDSLLFETSHETINPKVLHVTSTRVGRVPGTHEIGFDSPADLIQLKHQAHGRLGFAFGAVRAAEWILGKKGLFSMDDFMESMNKI
jgi:4-hydroxy-tetrahydrodipicolinate reductase